MMHAGEFQVGSLKLHLTLMRPSEIFPHEEVIPHSLNSLVNSLKYDGAQLDPVIVDSSSKVVLDGMHRLQALRDMGARRIMVCEVDYSDKSILVNRWLRCWVRIDLRVSKKIIRELALQATSSAKEAIALVDKKRSPIAMLTGSGAYVSQENTSETIEAHQLVKKIDTLLEIGESIEILHESEALQGLAGRHEAVFYPPRITKRDVIESGLNGRLFPAKSTRHTIPVRPVGMDVPIEILVKEKSDTKAKEDFEKSLSGLSYTMLKPGSIYRGRTYQDSLMLFEKNPS